MRNCNRAYKGEIRDAGTCDSESIQGRKLKSGWISGFNAGRMRGRRLLATATAAEVAAAAAPAPELGAVATRGAKQPAAWARASGASESSSGLLQGTRSSGPRRRRRSRSLQRQSSGQRRRSQEAAAPKRGLELRGVGKLSGLLQGARTKEQWAAMAAEVAAAVAPDLGAADAAAEHGPRVVGNGSAVGPRGKESRLS